jgi:valyl-tRNA synthetase
LNGLSLIPIIGDESVNPKFGTGAVKVTPGHDQTDFEIGKRHQLPILNVIGEEGNIRFRVDDEGGNDNKIYASHESLNANGEKFKVNQIATFKG